jgi:SAP domain-containing ribonucleoprotein
VTPGANETSKTSAPAPAAPVDDELEKRKARAARFGIALVESPKPKTKTNPTSAPAPAPASKAAQTSDVRFALSEPNRVNGINDTLHLQDPEKLKAREQRFGASKVEQKESANAPAVGNKKRGAAVVEEVDPDEQERRRKRAERFGIPAMVRNCLMIHKSLLRVSHRAQKLEVLRLRSDHKYTSFADFVDNICCKDRGRG